MKTIPIPKLRKLTGTKAERTVIIAKDVLKQLVAGRVVAHRGSYLTELDSYSLPKFIRLNPDEDGRDAVLAQASPCEACAVGAMFVSALRIFDDFTIPSRLGGGSIYSEEMFEVLRRHMPEKVMDTMENIFEGEPTSNGKKQYEWHRWNVSDQQALTTIMRHLVKHNGKFDLDALLATAKRQMGKKW